MEKKIQKRYLIFEIAASEMAAVNCLCYEGNTCHGQSTDILSNRIFLDIYLNTFFVVRKFGNKPAMRLSFFENVQNMIKI